MPIGSSRDAEARLADPAKLTESDVRELMPYVRTISEGGLRRLYLELALQDIAAIIKFDQSSGRLSKRILCLTWVLVGLTVAMTAAAILSAIPAICKAVR